MNTNIAAIRQPSDLMSMLSIKASAGDHINTSPLEGGHFVCDPNMDPIEQAEAILSHYGVDIPDDISSGKFKMPDGLSDEQKYQWILNSEKLANLEFKKTTDAFYNARASLPQGVIEDGRSHITGIFDLVGNVNKNYQQIFGEITKSATEYMKDFNTTLGKLSSAMGVGKDGKISYDKDKFLNNFYGGVGKYVKSAGFTAASNGELKINKNNFQDYTYPMTSISLDNIDPEVAKSMVTFYEKKLEGQGFFVKENNGKIDIYPDVTPVLAAFRTAKTVSNTTTSPVDILSQAFQSMQTALDSHKNTVNSSTSRLLETFRQDNSHFETLTQLLIQLLKDLFQYNAGFANS